MILFSKRSKTVFSAESNVKCFWKLKFNGVAYSWLSRLKQQAQLALKLLNANHSLARVFLSQVTGLQRSMQAACNNFFEVLQT